MTEIPVSVVIVSRDRPAALQRCLTGIEQLDYRNFEVIVVADAKGCAAVRDMGLGDTVKMAPFDEPNISAARNLGIEQTAGEVVAFIDDDAVPEPSWLTFLTEPFADAEIAAAGGYVRGRNGITFQSTAAWVDECGDETPMPGREKTEIILYKMDKAVKTEGTNCAFRRNVLYKLHGFDPAFRFYLDETDLNLRLSADNFKTAIVPLAQVHHGFFPSAYRTMSRMPKDLFEIGASQVVFLRKHATPDKLDIKINSFRAEQRARLIRHMVAGTCEPRDVARVMQTLENGIIAGQTRPYGNTLAKQSKSLKFKEFIPRMRYHTTHIIARLGLLDRGARHQAAKLLANGTRVTLFQFSLTALYHRVEFVGGIWLHKGGLFGRSVRHAKVLTFWRKKSRLRHEIDLIMPQRLINKGKRNCALATSRDVN